MSTIPPVSSVTAVRRPAAYLVLIEGAKDMTRTGAARISHLFLAALMFTPLALATLNQAAQIFA